MQTNDQLIKAEIARLEATGSADWQSLMRQVGNEVQPRVLTYNLAQLAAATVPATVKHLDLEWGRGTGKTTVFAHFGREIVTDMPRSVGQWVVPSYRKFLTEIIPSWIHGMEMQGFYQGLHYFVNQRPPARWNWPKPYKPPTNYDSFISFWNGAGIFLISQDIEGSGRGLNTDFELADEVALLSVKKMEENTNPSLRGSNVRALGHKRWFDFRLKATSTPLTDAGVWFTDRELMAMQTPERHRFIKANCRVNLHNLKPDYLTEAERTTSERWIYEAEYLNVRPKMVRGGFYFLLDEDVHAYTANDYGHIANRVGAALDCRADADLVPTLPLILGVDWGAAINSVVVCQHPGPEFRALRNFYAKGRDGETQDDAFRRFAAYYAPHPTKTVYLWYDQTGNHANGMVKRTRAMQAVEQLTSLGWKVVRMSVGGTNPRHFEKYELWRALLEERDPRLPRIRINREGCRELWLAMSRAKATQDRTGEWKKDKSGERASNTKRELATDLTDAVDQPVFGLFNQLARGRGIGGGGGVDLLG